jgi:hypothetical protein
MSIFRHYRKHRTSSYIPLRKPRESEDIDKTLVLLYKAHYTDDMSKKLQLDHVKSHQLLEFLLEHSLLHHFLLMVSLRVWGEYNYSKQPCFDETFKEIIYALE